MSEEIKNGRPLKFKTVQDMQDVIDEYFEWCDNRVRTVYSKKRDDVFEMTDPAPYTMAGLARRLGLSRQALLDYKKRTDEHGQDFVDAIKEARMRVQEDVETRLMEGQAAGSIFNLKNNFGYVDQQQVDGTQEVIVTTRKHKKDGSKNS